MSDAASPRPCLNCATELQGPFCHRCGQKDQARRLPLKALFHDVLHDIWHFDHKVLETLRLLVFKPGLLTLAYLDGRRSRYVPPFRLYIFMSFLLFSAFAMIHTEGRKKTAEAPATVIAPVKVVTATAGTEMPQIDTKSQPRWAQDLNARIHAAVKDPGAFRHAFLSNLSKSLFLLMPLFAAMLQLLYIRRRPLFVDHLVLSLHHHVLSFLVILALLGLAALPGEDWATLPGVALFLLPPFHLAASLRRIHGQGWAKSLLKTAMVSCAYGFTVAITLLALLVLSLPKV